jgi:hypothetical protein
MLRKRSWTSHRKNTVLCGQNDKRQQRSPHSQLRARRTPLPNESRSDRDRADALTRGEILPMSVIVAPLYSQKSLARLAVSRVGEKKTGRIHSSHQHLSGSEHSIAWSPVDPCAQWELDRASRTSCGKLHASLLWVHPWGD